MDNNKEIELIETNDNEVIDVMQVDDNENISTTEIEGNEVIGSVALNILLKGSKGEKGETSMTEIELSTDLTKPTELMDYISTSGTYVAKNKGVLGYDGQPVTILNKGQFFKIFNMKDLYSITGEELSDEQNLIRIDIPSLEGFNISVYISGSGEIQEAYEINSININDYINIDTSNLLSKSSNINYNYGINLVNNYLAIRQASNYEIDNGVSQYCAITANNIAYAVQKKGEKYFTKITDFDKLNSDVNTLKSEIEAILDTVVSI